MKRLSTLALTVVLVALPVCAQRGASRGGFSGRAAQSFHGGFTQSFRGGFRGSAPSRFAGTARTTPERSNSYGARSFMMPRGLQNARSRGFGDRQPYMGDDRHRREYRRPYWPVTSYVAPGWGIPYYLAYPDDFGDDESQSASNYAPEGYYDQPADQEEPAPEIPYQAAPNLPYPQTAPANESAVTLVFKDGRPSEQIHNYVLTPTTLYVGDQHRREIPTDQLDLVATAKVNHDAGVDFRLPGVNR